ncbi:cadmium-translocating P-type ATPase [Granulicella sp. 5B5]|uniref:heavy metal translocating P-type ATPase n=1 Tax=Granulicella sp. 5B5 TaxID=1617967 RepID=UPI001751F43E|nr:heavy metal translocating P-type ATPase [Granulicella sp. 5B5]QMV17736.1 cadmium-translocating P-type ATPase [Granulicella sp. 5B5]
MTSISAENEAQTSTEDRSLQIAGMSCAACQVHVQSALAAVPGVTSANVNLMTHRAQISTSVPVSTESLISAVRNAGYDASVPSTESSTSNHKSPAPDEDTDSVGLRALAALIAGCAAMLLSMPLMMATRTDDPLLALSARLLAPFMPGWLMTLPLQPLRWLLCALAAGTMVFAAPSIYLAAWRAARHRTTNMNTLVALGTLIAFLASFATTVAPNTLHKHGFAADVYFEAVILILGFLLAGRWLEARARSSATAALRGFAQLEAPDARLLDLPPGSSLNAYASARETRLPLQAIAAGDILRILPGDRVPLDGIILQGRSSIDESMLTGEPLPVTRAISDRVYGGTVNIDGVLIVRATAVGESSTLAQMQRLLDQAQSGRAPMQRIADRVSATFVPSVLAFSAATFIVWIVAGNITHQQNILGHALSAAIASLIIACPCAMGLAVPAAVTVSLGRAAQSGLLIKGGEALERLADIDTFALDKTGTITLGRPQVAAFVLAPKATLSKATILSYAATLERLSTHPLAAAVVEFAERESSLAAAPLVEQTQVLPGIGIQAQIDGRLVIVGNASLLDDSSTPMVPPATLMQATPIFVVVDHIPQAAFFATDDLRPTARGAISQLLALHIHPLLLTGDTSASAAPIAAAAGIEDVHAHLLPQQKLDAIRKLKSKGHHVAMAGDGINDAAALALCDVGFAMSSGSDLAREAGDVLLLNSDLRLLPAAVRLSRRTTRIMRQNLGWALVYNAIGLPIAAGVLYPHFHILLSPALASAAMALSSVSVLANSLRLRHVPSA